jgi:AraC-like DNA-binding protein/quercetin dioxygenase-like cupin family protein
MCEAGRAPRHAGRIRYPKAGRTHRVEQHRSVATGIEAITLASDHHFPRHAHDQFGIGLILAGAQKSWSGIGAVEAGAGDAIMANPGEIHDGMPLGEGARSWRMLYFDPSLVAEDAVDAAVTHREIIRPSVRDPVLAGHFGRLFAAVTATIADPLAIEEGRLRLVAHVLGRHGQRPMRATRPPPVAQALAHIDAAPAAPVTLAALAALSGVSRFQLLRGFAAAIGATPHAYLLQRRVGLARQLLAAGLSAAEAAIDAGFADQSHMTRAFVRQFGITPGRYVAALARSNERAIFVA